MRTVRAPGFAGACLAVILGSSPAAAQWVATNGPVGAQANALALSGGALYAGTAGAGVARAADGYTRWVPVNSGLTNANVLSLAAGVNEFGSRLLLAGTHGGGVFWSSNDGGRWSPGNTGLTNRVVRAVAVVPDPYFGNGMVLFAGTDSGVFRSNAGGLGMWWFPRNAGLRNTLVRALAAFFEGSDENDGIGAHDLLAGTAGGGAFVSTDGAAWWAKGAGLTNTNVAALAASSPDAIYAGTVGGGVFRSRSTFGPWTAVNTGLTNGVVQAIATGGTTVFVGTAGGGVFASGNGGASWRAVSHGLPNLAITALATDGTDVFAATATGVYRRPLAEMIAP
jgi:hypothetical protein